MTHIDFLYFIQEIPVVLTKVKENVDATLSNFNLVKD